MRPSCGSFIGTVITKSISTVGRCVGHVTLRAFDCFSAKSQTSKTRPRHFCRKFILNLLISLQSECCLESGQRDNFNECSVVLRPGCPKGSGTIVLRFGMQDTEGKGDLRRATRSTVTRVERQGCDRRLGVGKVASDRVGRCKITFRNGAILVIS